MYKMKEQKFMGKVNMISALIIVIAVSLAVCADEPITESYAKSGDTDILTEQEMGYLSIPKDSLVWINEINIEYTENGEVELSSINIVSLSLDAVITLTDEQSLVRVVLEDDQERQYVVFDSTSFPETEIDLVNYCEETCNLDYLFVKKLIIRVEGAVANIHSINLQKSIADTKDLLLSQAEYKQGREQIRIEKLNERIMEKGQMWIAGETPISQMSYDEKRRWYGDEWPNFHGFEYYTGGIFNMPEEDIAPEQPMVNTAGDSCSDSKDFVCPSGCTIRDDYDCCTLNYEYGDWDICQNCFDESDEVCHEACQFKLNVDIDCCEGAGGIWLDNDCEVNFPDYFDWRDRHGENWNSGIRNQGDCGSCWAHGALGAVEGVINLYYNQHLDLDLSEQDTISCSTGGDCNGGNVGPALDYFRDTGVVDESCFAYTATDDDCANKCLDWENRLWKINGNHNLETLVLNDFKLILIEKGISGISYEPWRHAMTAVGYGKIDWSWRTTANCYLAELCELSGCVSHDYELEPGDLGHRKCIYRSHGFGSQDQQLEEELDSYIYEVVEDPKAGLVWSGAICPDGTMCVEGDVVECVPGTRRIDNCETGDIICLDSKIVECDPGYEATYITVKNSWGTGWGENGYGKVMPPINQNNQLVNFRFLPIETPITPPIDTNFWPEGFTGEIRCVNNDADYYCNWGISLEKPTTCPDSCGDEKDCDDSDPAIGACDYSPPGLFNFINDWIDGLISLQDLLSEIQRFSQSG